MAKSIFTDEMLNLTSFYIGKAAEVEKHAFVDAGMAAGAPPAGGDPAAAAGGAPPMDPSMMGAGAAPPDAGGGGDPALSAKLDQMMQLLQAGGGGGGGGAGGAGGAGIKPKIDVNIEIMQMKKMIAKICDTLGIQMSAAELTATTQDLTQMAAQPGSDPSAAGGGGAAPQSAIAPIGPIQGASPALAGGGAPPAGGDAGGGMPKAGSVERGEAYVQDSLQRMTNQAAALAAVMTRAR